MGNKGKRKQIKKLFNSFSEDMNPENKNKKLSHKLLISSENELVYNKLSVS